MKSAKHKGILQLLLVSLFILAAFIASRVMKNGYKPPVRNGGEVRKLYVSTTECTPEPYRIVFQTTGTVVALAEVNIVPQVSGRITEVAPDFYDGGLFEGSETLFRIDPRDYELEVERLRAEVVRAETALQLEAAEVEAALQEWARMNGDRPAPDLVARKPQIAEAEANLKAARAQLENAQLDLARTHFDLPQAGRVLNSQIASGQFVQAGQGYGAVFYSDALEVSASLEGEELKWLLETPDVEIAIEADYMGRTLRYAGKLNRSVAAIDASTRFATARFGFEETPRELLPGVFVHVTVYGPIFQNVARLPVSALQQDGAVWLVDSDNRLQRFTPEIIFRESDFIAVSNLKGAAAIVTNDLPGATEGALVVNN